MVPRKMQKIKQYSSQPGGQTQPKLTDEDEHVFAGSDLEQYKPNETQADSKQNDTAFKGFCDQSAQKVSTISSLGGGTKSIIENNGKNPSASTTKGSQIIRQHMKRKRSQAKEDAHEQFLNSSMPIALPNQ